MVNGQPEAQRPAPSATKRLVFALYAALGAISMILGGIYIASPEFMHYHAIAIGREWSALTDREQVLFSALLDVAGAGWLTLGIAVIALAAVPIRRGERWARYLAPMLLAIFYVPTLLATLSVLTKTPATPPWWGNVIVLVATGLAFVLDRPFLKDRESA